MSLTRTFLQRQIGWCASSVLRVEGMEDVKTIFHFALSLSYTCMCRALHRASHFVCEPKRVIPSVVCAASGRLGGVGGVGAARGGARRRGARRRSMRGRKGARRRQTQPAQQRFCSLAASPSPLGEVKEPTRMRFKG